MDIKLEKLRCCDFCKSDEPNAPYVWVFTRQVFPAGTDIGLLFQMLEHPEWFACEKCHKMLLNQDVVGLVADKSEAERPYFTKLYQSLIENTQRN